MKSLFKHVLLLTVLVQSTWNLNAQISILFSEDFTSNSFSTNNWTFPNGQGNWIIGSANTPSGATAPSAIFNSASGVGLPFSYSYAMVSNTINATAINGPVTLSYLLLFNPNTTPVVSEYFDVEYKDVSSSTWSLLASYSNTATAIQNYTATNLNLSGMTGTVFQIRFKAYGANWLQLTRWCLDNISVAGTNCPLTMPSVSITGPSTLCAGTTATLTAVGGGATYTWSPMAGNASLSLVSPTSNITYTLLSALDGCTTSPSSAVKSLTVFTNTTPITASVSASAICIGASVSLSSGGAPSYSWSNGVTTASQVVTPTATIIYSVSSSNSLGCLATQSLAVTVYPLPSISASTTNTLICFGNATNLTAGGASTYTWSSGSTGSVSLVSPTVTSIYTVSGTDLHGCISSNTIALSVLPPVTIVTTGTAFCPGNGVTLIANGAVNYTWSTGATAQGISLTPSVSTVYAVIGMHSIGCSSTASVSILVYPNPTISIVATSTSICSGKTATLNVTGASTYTWSNLLNGSAITVSPLVNTVYSVSGLSSAGCSGANNSASVSIQVKPNPTVTALSTPSAICYGNQVSLNAAGANTYSWSQGSSGPSITVSPTISTTYSVTGTSTLLCSSVGTVAVVVKPLPLITISSNTTALCMGSTATLLATGAVTYSWSNGSTVNVVYVTPQTNTIYSVSGTDANNCTGTKSIAITVNNYPVISVNGTDSIICSGETTTLNASGALSYFWGNSLTGSVVAVSPSVTTTYTVEGSNNGCITTATVTQRVDECVGVKVNKLSPHLFSVYPNPGTGVYAVDIHSGQQNVKLDVLNTVGQSVFYRNLFPGENAVDLQQLPNGIYYFRILEGEKISVLKVSKH